MTYGEEKLLIISRIIAYIFVTISFIFSGIIISIIYRNKLYRNLTNQFIIQLTVSEMINNITNFINIFPTFMGTKEEKYHERMRVCYTQIYSGLFSNFFTLFSSLLIALRIHDLLVNNSKLFKNPRNVKLAKLFSVFICFLMSYIIWLLQMNQFQGYEDTSIKYYLVLSCWLGDILNYITLGIFAIFIVLMFYFCIHSYIFISKYTENYLVNESTNEGEEAEQNSEELTKARKVQKKLLLYPITTCILYLLIILYSIFSLVIKEKDEETSSINIYKIVSIIFYTIPTVSRGFIFAMVYVGSQTTVKQALLEFILCRCDKKKELNQIQITPDISLPDEE